MPHHISDVDPEARLGTCSICGTSSRIVPNQNVWRCRKARLDSHNRTSKSPHHGLTTNEMNLLKDKYGKCQICAYPRDLRIDHSHDTDKVRGVLCNYCNTALYVVERNKLWGFRALWYLGSSHWRKP